ncbi:MAG: DUF4229 domain-containing protein [Rhodoglobus sp.]
MKPWLSYSLARVGLFVVVLSALMLLGVPGWLGAIIAAVISLCLSYLFLGRLRDAVARDIVTRRAQPTGGSDAAAEDA